MIKKTLYVVYASGILLINAHEPSLIEMHVILGTPDKTTSTMVESAVQEAIQCLQQLQERLLQELIHQWAEGLQDYLRKLLNHQVNIHIITHHEEREAHDISFKKQRTSGAIIVKDAMDNILERITF